MALFDIDKFDPSANSTNPTAPAADPLAQRIEGVPELKSDKPQEFDPFAKIGASVTDNTLISAVINEGWRTGGDVSMDEGFNPVKAVRGTDYEEFAMELAGAQNEMQLAAMKRDIDRKRMIDKIRAQTGTGTQLAWGLLAGVADAPSLLPGGVALNSLRQAKNLSTVSRTTLTAGSVGVAAGAGAAVGEMALHTTQIGRTGEESVVAIGASVALGGLLGAGIGRLSARQIAKAEKAVADTFDMPDNAPAPREQSPLEMELDRVRSDPNPTVEAAPAPIEAAAPPRSADLPTERPVDAAPVDVDTVPAARAEPTEGTLIPDEATAAAPRAAEAPEIGTQIPGSIAKEAPAAVEGVPASRTVASAIPTDDAISATPPTPGRAAGVFKVDATKLEVDAERFQFKDGGDTEGVTDRLKGVKKWDESKANQVIAWQDESGRLFVVDGHQRSGLARRIASETGERIDVAALVYREADGWKAADVMILAAEKNIAEGSGTIIDAAKVMKARPDVVKGLEGISDYKIAQARDLAKLGDEPFRSVINGVVTPEQGAIVGRVIPSDPARQAAAIGDINKIGPRNALETEALVNRSKEAAIAKSEAANQGSLFDMNEMNTAVKEELSIIDKAVKALKADKELFARVGRDADRIEGGGVGRVDKEASAEIAKDASKVATYIAKEAYQAGPIRDALLRLAAAVKNGEVKIGKAVDEFVTEVKENLRARDDSAPSIARDPEMEGLFDYQPEGLFAGEGASVGAAKVPKAVDTRPTVADLTPAGKAVDWLIRKTGAIAPNLRQNVAPVAAARRIAQQLAENTIYQVMHTGGNTLGPAVETLARGEFQRIMAAGKVAHDSAFRDMIGAGVKMTRQEFNSAIGQAMRRGDKGANEHVSKAAESWRRIVFDPLKERAIKAGMLPADVDVKTAESYFSRVYQVQKMIAKEPEFKSIAKNWLREKLTAEFDGANARLETARMDIDRQIADLGGDGDTAFMRVAEANRALSDLEAANPEKLDALRKAGEATSVERQAQKRARDMEEAGPRKFEGTYDDYKAALAEARAEAAAAKEAAKAAYVDGGGRAEVMAFARERNKLKAQKSLNNETIDQARELSRMQQEIADLQLTPEQRSDVLATLDQAKSDLYAKNPGAKLRIEAISKLMSDRAKFNAEGKVKEADGALAQIADIREGGGDDLAAFRRELGSITERQRRLKGDESGVAEKRAAIEEKVTAQREALQKKVTAIANAAGVLKVQMNNVARQVSADASSARAELRQGIRDLNREIEGIITKQTEAALDFDGALTKELTDETADFSPGFLKGIAREEELAARRLERVRNAAAEIEDAMRVDPTSFDVPSPENAARVARLQGELAAYLQTAAKHVENQGRRIEKVASRLDDEKLNPRSNADRAADLMTERDRRLADYGSERATRAEKLREEFDAREQAHWEKWNIGRDADEGFDGYLNTAVNAIFDKITGRHVGDLPDGIVPLSVGPLKERTFNIPDRLIEDFLESDIEMVGERYARKLSGEIELKTRFGDATMKDQIAEINKEYADLAKKVSEAGSDAEARAIALYEPGAGDKFDLYKKGLGAVVMPEREKILLFIEGQRKESVQDIGAMRDLIRGTYNTAAAGSGWGRTVRVAQAFNYIRQMGNVLIASIGDVYRPATVAGLSTYMAEGIPTLIRSLEFDLKGGWFPGLKTGDATIQARVREEVRLAGNALDRVLAARMATMAEMGDPYVAQTGAERLVQNGSRLGSRWNGLSLWTDVMKEVSGTLTMNRIAKAVTKPDGDDVRWLAQLGIGKEWSQKIAGEISRHGESIDGVMVANTERWTDLDAQVLFRAALNKSIDTAIVTKSVGDVPLWTHSNVGKLIFQFKSFMASSYSRMLLQGMQGDQSTFVGGLIAMTTLGMLTTYLRAASTNRVDKLSTNPGWWIGEGLDAGGIFAVPFEAANMAEKLTGINPIKSPLIGAANMAGFKNDKKESLRFQSRGLAGAFLGPTVGGLVDDVGNVGKAMTGNGSRNQTIDSIARLVPYYSYPGMRQIIEYAVKPAFKDPPRR